MKAITINILIFLKVRDFQTFKKRAVFWYFYATLNIFSYTGDNLEIKKALISMKNPLTYQIKDKKPLNAENCAKTIEKNPPKHECARLHVLSNRT